MSINEPDQVIVTLQRLLEDIEEDFPLLQEKSFEMRLETIDFLDFQMMDHIQTLLETTTERRELHLIKARVERIKSKLEEINHKLFDQLRATIRTSRCRGRDFDALCREFVDLSIDPDEFVEDNGYDDLDVFVNGLTLYRPFPAQTQVLAPEMVYYQKTPVRIVIDWVNNSPDFKDDVFIDLGSGLGQVAMLVHLLTGIKTQGIEIDACLCDYARERAEELGLTDVTFLNMDARYADLSEGTLFFLFTSFKGCLLQEVLDKLSQEARLRTIRIIAFGSCTDQVSSQNWLTSDSRKRGFQVFSSENV